MQNLRAITVQNSFGNLSQAAVKALNDERGKFPLVCPVRLDATLHHRKIWASVIFDRTDPTDHVLRVDLVGRVNRGEVYREPIIRVKEVGGGYQIQDYWLQNAPSAASFTIANSSEILAFCNQIGETPYIGYIERRLAVDEMHLEILELHNAGIASENDTYTAVLRVLSQSA